MVLIHSLFRRFFFLHTIQYTVTSILKLKRMEDLDSKPTNAMHEDICLSVSTFLRYTSEVNTFVLSEDVIMCLRDNESSKGDSTYVLGCEFTQKIT